MADDKNKTGYQDAAKVNFSEPYEVSYFKREVKAASPHATDAQIEKAITECRVTAGSGRIKLLACVKAKLG